MRIRIQCFSLFLIVLLCSLPIIGQDLPAIAEINAPVSDVYCFNKPYSMSIPASACILMDADSGRVLFSSNEHKRLPMASTTKIMTAVLTLENSHSDAEVVVPKETTDIEGSSIYLTEGETVSVNELLYGMMLPSGNDAATTLAWFCGGSVESFVMMMNIKAGELGLKNTHFANPSGLPDDNHYSSAYDMAVLASYAIKNKAFTDITSTIKTTISRGSRYLVNRNKLLRHYDGLIGIKTGYTKTAGRCLVTAATRNGVTLVAVTLNDSNTWGDHIGLLNFGFGMLERKTIAAKNEIVTEAAITNGGAMFVTASNNEDVLCSLPKTCEINIVIPADIKINAPVNCGDVVCHADIYADGCYIQSIPLYAQTSVQKQKQSIFERLFGKWKA